jgi:hypothetical protein
MSIDPSPCTGTEPAPLTLLREQWLQALFLTAGASLHMDAGRDCVTLSVTIPLDSVEKPCTVMVPNVPSALPPQVGRDATKPSKGVWLRLKVPQDLRRRFKAVAWRRQIRPYDLIRMFIEEFAESGRVPTGKGVERRSRLHLSTPTE